MSNQEQDKKQEYINLGKADGETVKTSQAGFEGCQRQVMTETAKLFVSAETHNIDTNAVNWLLGFGEVMGKTKKSEASIVLYAYAKDSTKVQEFHGGYNSWIAHCREIKNGETSPKERTGTRKVSDKGIAAIAIAVSVMNAGQVKALLEKLYFQLKAVSGDNWEKAFLIEIEGLADAIGNSPHPIFQNMSNSILDVGAEYLDREAANAAKAQAASQHQEPQTGNTIIEGEATLVNENVGNLVPFQPAPMEAEVQEQDDGDQQQAAA